MRIAAPGLSCLVQPAASSGVPWRRVRGYAAAMDDTALSLLMLASFALIVGAIVRGRREGFGRNVWLMLVAAAVMLANVAIWVL